VYRQNKIPVLILAYNYNYKGCKYIRISIIWRW